MNDTNTVELDSETLNNLDELVKEAGLSNDEYLRLLILDRASARLKEQKGECSLFLP